MFAGENYLWGNVSIPRLHKILSYFPQIAITISRQEFDRFLEARCVPSCVAAA